MTIDEAYTTVFGKPYIVPSEKYKEARTVIDKALEEIREYQLIGTVEECREAVEKKKKLIGVCRMTNQEAINNFKCHLTEPLSPFSIMDCIMAIKALEKQIPKQPIDNAAFGMCPSCHKEFNSELISEYDMKYCIYCGQALDQEGGRKIQDE